MGLEDFYNGREGGIDGLENEFHDRVAQMFDQMPDEIAGGVSISSAYRSEAHQQELWEAAVTKYGSEAAARKWVAPPGRSNHGHGRAMDIKFTTDQARRWFHDNASRYGLAFPLSHEPWHIEPLGLRDGTYKPDEEHGHVQADPEAYTDADEFQGPNNNSLKTQLLRVADVMQGGGYTEEYRSRLARPAALAKNNEIAGIGDYQ